MLDTKIKDPRLGFVTITDVRVTGDLQSASIFYTVLGDEESRKRTAAALESAKGLLRSEVGKQTGVRLTPTLTFHLDAVPETAATITDALAEAQRRDAEVAALREGKSYADGEDPYRKPRVIEADEAELHNGGFDPLHDDEENLDAPTEYHGLPEFDSLADKDHFAETRIDG
jgi:ribosome-binding factor A